MFFQYILDASFLIEMFLSILLDLHLLPCYHLKNGLDWNNHVVSLKLVNCCFRGLRIPSLLGCSAECHTSSLPYGNQEMKLQWWLKRTSTM
jgi:hypothetical protein